MSGMSAGAAGRRQANKYGADPFAWKRGRRTAPGRRRPDVAGGRRGYASPYPDDRCRGRSGTTSAARRAGTGRVIGPGPSIPKRWRRSWRRWCLPAQTPPRPAPPGGRGHQRAKRHNSATRRGADWHGQPLCVIAAPASTACLRRAVPAGVLPPPKAGDGFTRHWWRQARTLALHPQIPRAPPGARLRADITGVLRAALRSGASALSQGAAKAQLLLTGHRGVAKSRCLQRWPVGDWQCN